MKIKNLPIKPLKTKFEKTFIIIGLLILSCSGCKISYEDIHFEDYSGKGSAISGFPHENYGYLIYDTESEKIVKGHSIRKAFIPASVTKLFTALFAAETLGVDYIFTTELSYKGSVKKGILTGDLYLKGSGDPELSLDGLLSLVNSLKSKKIKELQGNFYFDESSFKSRDMLDKDMPADAYYNSGISPLSFNSNIIYALQNRNSKWQIVSVDFLPSLQSFGSYIYTEDLPYPYLKYKLTGDKEIWGLPQKNLWDNRQQLPVKRPGLYTAETLRQLCIIHGIKLPAPRSGNTGSDTKIISTYESRPLTDILKNMLFTSNNLTAELLYTVSADSYEEMKNSQSAIEHFYNSNFTGISWENFKNINASGLTNLNRATPEQTCAILLYIDKIEKEKFNLEAILPLSGWEGTMKSRLDHPESALRVYGKTGSIFYSSGLAGVFYGASGKRYIYSVYINDFSKRLEYDTKKEKTADDLNQGGAWTKKAADSTDEFILKMIREL